MKAVQALRKLVRARGETRGEVTLAEASEPEHHTTIVVELTRDGMLVGRSMAMKIPWTSEYWRESTARPLVYVNRVPLFSKPAPANVGSVDGVRAYEKATGRWVAHGPLLANASINKGDTLSYEPGDMELDMNQAHAKWLGRPAE